MNWYDESKNNEGVMQAKGPPKPTFVFYNFLTQHPHHDELIVRNSISTIFQIDESQI